jgi:N-glycosylase/DNA lyase
MLADGIIKERPKSLTKKKYLEIEKKFRQLANKLGMSCAELDLYMWYMKTGWVLK